MEIQKYDQRTDQRTDRLTWVGARDACASKNNWGPLSSTFHVGRPETLTDWKSESVTDGRTNLQTDMGRC